MGILQLLWGIKQKPDRSGDDAMGPRCDASPRIESTPQPMVRIGAVKIALHIVFARPQELHRGIDFLRDHPRFGGIVPLVPAAEGAATKHHVYGDLARWHTGERGDLALDDFAGLRRRPNLD